MRRSGGRGGGSLPFVPISVGDARLWLRADLGITLNDADVSGWADQSGEGNDLSQGTAADQPVYNASDADYNGRPSVEADGVSEYLLGSGSTLVSAASGTDTPWTVILAGHVEDTDATMALYSWGTSTGANGWHYVGSQTAGEVTASRRADDTVGNVNQSGSTAVNAACVFSTVFTGTAVSTYVNGTVDIDGAAQDVGAVSCDQFALFARARSTPSFFATGTIAEVVVYAGALSDADRTTVENYMAARYGL